MWVLVILLGAVNHSHIEHPAVVSGYSSEATCKEGAAAVEKAFHEKAPIETLCIQVK